jgi:hypothetical protein
LGKKYMLWNDAEMVILKPMSMTAAFDAYFKKPFVFYSRTWNGEGGWHNMGPPFEDLSRFSLNLVYGTEQAYGANWPRYLNLMGYQGWMIEAFIIEDLFLALENRSGKSLAEHICDTPGEQFEPFVLYTFMFHAGRRYHYHFVCFEDMMPKYLLDHTQKYLEPHVSSAYYRQGIECMLNHVTEEMVDGFSRFMNDYSLTFFRYDCIEPDQHIREVVFPNIWKQVPSLAVQVCSEPIFTPPI